mmetsp:Transcript_105962/g.265385  ORF Transcript_105962/g.265385 Transcript_105962/m.265385 type:complete len:324 (+) Transcript_105962:227-1198(+)
MRSRRRLKGLEEKTKRRSMLSARRRKTTRSMRNWQTQKRIWMPKQFRKRGKMRSKAKWISRKKTLVKMARASCRRMRKTGKIMARGMRSCLGKMRSTRMRRFIQQIPRKMRMRCQSRTNLTSMKAKVRRIWRMRRRKHGTSSRRWRMRRVEIAGSPSATITKNMSRRFPGMDSLSSTISSEQRHLRLSDLAEMTPMGKAKQRWCRWRLRWLQQQQQLRQLLELHRNQQEKEKLNKLAMMMPSPQQNEDDWGRRSPRGRTSVSTTPHTSKTYVARPSTASMPGSNNFLLMWLARRRPLAWQLAQSAVISSRVPVSLLWEALVRR